MLFIMWHTLHLYRYTEPRSTQPVDTWTSSSSPKRNTPPQALIPGQNDWGCGVIRAHKSEGREGISASRRSVPDTRQDILNLPAERSGYFLTQYPMAMASPITPAAPV